MDYSGMEAQERKIVFYGTIDGKVPYSDWATSLSDKTQSLLDKRLGRVARGNFGDCEPAGKVKEFRIDYGPGYRIYFQQKGLMVIVLMGGSKKAQQQDIKKAEVYWADYEEREGSS